MTNRGSTVPNQPAGAFWAVLNRLFIIAQVVVLIFSEFGVPAKFFNVYFPVLGKDFGLGALGLIQMLYVFHFLLLTRHRFEYFFQASAQRYCRTMLILSHSCLPSSSSQSAASMSLSASSSARVPSPNVPSLPGAIMQKVQFLPTSAA